MAIEKEEIPGHDNVAKSIFFPKDFDNYKNLIWAPIFQFSTDYSTGLPYGESVIWEKYAPEDQDKHAIGLSIAENRKQKFNKPDYSYEGFLQSAVDAIRSIKSNRGHGLEVEHAPSEGIYHAEIVINISKGTDLKKNDKNELKGFLQKVFNNLVAY